MITTLDLSSKEAKNAQFACIDLMKFICAILVVTIHTSPFKNVSPLLDYGLTQYIARLAVPFFFVASGYFLFRKTDYDNFDVNVPLTYAKRIFRLYLLWNAIYFVPFFILPY